MLSLTACVADPPPQIGVAVAGNGVVTVSWSAPIGDNASALAEYVVTPYIGNAAQPPSVFGATSRAGSVTGLTNGTEYTFSVHGINTLGNDTARSGRSAPVTPHSTATASRVTGADHHTCAVVNGGTVECWGANQHGQLGNGISAGPPSFTPVPVAGLTDAVEVSAGYDHTCALRATGTVVCWGYNGYGQLGDGSTIPSPIPVAVAGITGATEIQASYMGTCARIAEDTDNCWGAPGQDHSCEVLIDATVECQGMNTFGQLGNGTTSGPAYYNPPVPVTGITNAAAVTVGSTHSCATLTTGAVRCWGYNGEPTEDDPEPVHQGQLGNGTTIGSTTPVAVTGIIDAVSIGAGENHTCVVTTVGGIRCWGYGYYGQLGSGTTANGLTPVSVIGL